MHGLLFYKTPHVFFQFLISHERQGFVVQATEPELTRWQYLEKGSLGSQSIGVSDQSNFTFRCFSTVSVLDAGRAGFLRAVVVAVMIGLRHFVENDILRCHGLIITAKLQRR
jgi:hypothetical protein